MSVSGGWGVYLLFVIPPLLLGLWIQHRLKRTVAEQMQVQVTTGMTGAQVARAILDRNGLNEVPVERAPGGPLSDHYDPRKRAVFLSEQVHDGTAVASTAIGAHEVGHAIQHATAYGAFRLRSALWPAVAIANTGWYFLFIIGFFMNALGLIQLAILLFAVVVLFQLVTLPVEFDASRRAMKQLAGIGLVSDAERDGASKVLRAAAMTYVAAALAALTQLAYYALVFLGNRN
jgi:Zn-dependent membrane protease YugP